MRLNSLIALLLLLPILASAEIDAALESAAHVPPSIQARLHPELIQELEKALADAGDAATQLTSALDLLEGSLLDDAVFLLGRMPHLDRLEMSREVLVHHVVYADLARQVFEWRAPDSLYRQFLLTYRLDQEPITDWRAAFWPIVKKRARGITSTEKFVRDLNEWVAVSIREMEPEFFGGQQAPDQTLSAQRGTRKEIASLTTALLKTAGIPSRRVSVAAFLGQSGGAAWTEVFIIEKGQWLPLYPNAPECFGDFAWREPDSVQANVPYAEARSAFEALDVTLNYTATGELNIHFTRAGAPAAGFDGFTINVFNNGAFIAIDELEAVADAAGTFHCRLGDGQYWITAGTRDPSGSPWVNMQPVEVKSGLSTNLNINLTPKPYISTRPATAQAAADVPLFVINDAYSQVRSSREAIGKGPLLLVILRPNHEPSVRTKDLVQSWLNQREGKAPEVLWVMEGQQNSDDPAGGVNDPEGKVGQLFGLKSQDEYPLVLWVDKTGKITSTSKGYNLNIVAMLEAVEK
jgi:hypothetical protein